MIVCLGWGSLIWCQKRLPIAGTWQSDGPELPVEFARESRDKRITLVICKGRPVVKVLWAALDVQTLDEAKQALAVREGVEARNIQHSIGYWSPAGASSNPGTAAIGRWAAERPVQGVVWTTLKPGLKLSRNAGDYGIPTQEEVLQHLSGLEGRERDAAEEYVRLAPRQIVTPYRKAIEDAFGWSASGQL